METLHRANVTVGSDHIMYGSPAAAALSADSTEKRSPFDLDYLSTQVWNNSNIFDIWPIIHSYHLHQSQQSVFTCSPSALRFDDLRYLLTDFLPLSRLLSGPVREPPSHLRPGRQHVQKHDDRSREPVCHHQVGATL